MTKKEINKDYIRNYCKETEDRKAWYNNYVSTLVPELDKENNPILDEEGNPTFRKPTFIELQLAFIKQYFPELAPKPKRQKKESIYDLL